MPVTLAILYAGIVLSRPVITPLRSRHQPWEFLTAQMLFCLPLLFSVTWRDKGGFPFILTGRESFLTFLAAHDSRDFHSLVIEDIAVGSADAAHPFFYLNHPNLPSRLVSILAQAAGLDLAAQLLLAMCVSAVALLAAFIAFRHYVSSAFAFVLIAFLVTSYATFLPKAFDLLWGVNMALFWLIVYFLLHGFRASLAPPAEFPSLCLTFFVSFVGLGLSPVRGRRW